LEVTKTYQTPIAKTSQIGHIDDSRGIMIGQERIFSKSQESPKASFTEKES
jgi:hypothetical protein